MSVSLLMVPTLLGSLWGLLWLTTWLERLVPGADAEDDAFATPTRRRPLATRR